MIAVRNECGDTKKSQLQSITDKKETVLQVNLVMVLFRRITDACFEEVMYIMKDEELNLCL